MVKKMNAISSPLFKPINPIYSDLLRRTLSGLTGVAIAIVDAENTAIALSTLPNASANTALRIAPQRQDHSNSTLVDLSPKPFDSHELARLAAVVQPQNSQNGNWCGFVARFENAEVDQIAIHLAHEKDLQISQDLLSLFWPVVRDSCLRETQAVQDASGDDALLWMIASRIDLGVIVANQNGLILRANNAAKSLLKQGIALCRGHGGLRGIDDRQSRILRDAIAACSLSEPGSPDTMILLETAKGGPRVPVTLMRYLHGGQPTNLVTILLPAPPDPRRVEMLAKELGLTTAEARVAVQMQQGLSNREAAKGIGLKEQSFSTYAKRVLSKLNVNSRAEVAQLLTWQAHGGRIL